MSSRPYFGIDVRPAARVFKRELAVSWSVPAPKGSEALPEQDVRRHLALALDHDSRATLEDEASSSRRYVRSVTWIAPGGA